jgi:hypothetical protein
MILKPFVAIKHLVSCPIRSRHKDLANMRSPGVTKAMAYCKCGHQASIDVADLPRRRVRARNPAAPALHQMRRATHGDKTGLDRIAGYGQDGKLRRMTEVK